LGGLPQNIVSVMPITVLCVLLAAGAGHRARAEHFEALGRMAEAAREYEAAWEEEQAPELLYRLGIVRRKLKEYGKAREALRAYLRAAPEGGLREEVERQLAKIEVLIEAERESYADPPRRKRAPQPPATAPPQAVAAPEPAAQPVPIVIAVPPVQEPSLSPSTTTSTSVPPAALSRAVVEPPVAPRSRAVPWLFGASAVTAAAGAVLWWDGARVSREIDARFAAGDLSAADRPLFGRARGESIAGRALVIVGVGLLAAAVAEWW
jgi:hypothetical protein